MNLLPKKLELGSFREYVRQELGDGVFTVELTDQQIDNAILHGLLEFSKRKPLIGWATMIVSPEIKVYDIPHDVGYGIFNVTFLKPDPKPSALFYANLLDVAPIKASTMEGYDTFLRWRKTFMRVTSVVEAWQWDETNQKLMIYCPIDGSMVGYFWHSARELHQIPLQWVPWFKDYCVARAKKVLGEIRSKFSGVLPGPAQNLQMSSSELKTEAEAQIERLENELMKAQGDIPPMFV